MQKITFLTLKVMVMMNFEEQLIAKQKQMLICTLATYKITKTPNKNKINTYNYIYIYIKGHMRTKT
jgi:hypothetical protein